MNSYMPVSGAKMEPSQRVREIIRAQPIPIRAVRAEVECDHLVRLLVARALLLVSLGALRVALAVS